MNKEFNDSQHEHEFMFERVNFKKLLAGNANYFGSLGKQTAGAVQAIAYNTYYEEISSIGYNPGTATLEATVDVKIAAGFSGGLCSNGSFEYVRFYLDYGAGWEDQGYAAFNTHDIATSKDCQQLNNKPLSYVVSLNIKPKREYCDTPVTPKARAVLSWNSIPPANTPDYPSVWGNAFDCNIQIAPRPKFYVLNPDINLSSIIELAVANPTLSLSQAAAIVPEGKQSLAVAANSLQLKENSVAELVNIYQQTGLAVSAGRFGLKAVKAILQNPDIQFVNQQLEYYKKIGFDFTAAVNEITQTSANVNYEELTGVGLDYNRENFVASVHIKQSAGYSGNLCSGGSYEYVAFWADWNNNCEWEYLGTSAVNVHDINKMPEGGLCYSVTLPYDFTYKHKKCNTPYVVKVRAVLSWNSAPSTSDPNDLNTWGNLVDRYVQIKPGQEINPGDVTPIINILGGIPTSNISDTTGLTITDFSTSPATPPAFALNAVGVETGAPFAGIVTIQGPAFSGYKYRIKVTNLSNLASHYLTDPLPLAAQQSAFPFHTYWHTIYADANGFFTYQTYFDNLDSILARWIPGGDDKWQIDLEIETIAGTYTKQVQMDNTLPSAILNIDNNNDCTYYALGDTITGHFTATDDYISSYYLYSNFVGYIDTGNSNTTNQAFAFSTDANGTPCGSIDLVVYEKTIHDSVNTGYYSQQDPIICLRTINNK